MTILSCFHPSLKDVATTSLLVLVSSLLLQVNGYPYLREGSSSTRALLSGPMPHWMCSFFDDTIDHHCDNNNNSTNATATCPLVEPLAVFDLETFTSHSWFVQMQQVNGFQPSPQDDFFCLVHTFVDRGDEYFDYWQYGTTGQVDGPQQEWKAFGENTPDSMNTWCAGQDEEGGGLLRISPCLMRSLLSKVGFPMWVIGIAPDYSWAIVSGGEPETVRQVEPKTLCTTRTDVNGEVLADTSGTGLWLLTQERIASNETLAEMEDLLEDMRIYTGDLYAVVQEGCNYDNTVLVGGNDIPVDEAGESVGNEDVNEDFDPLW